MTQATLSVILFIDKEIMYGECSLYKHNSEYKLYW